MSGKHRGGRGGGGGVLEKKTKEDLGTLTSSEGGAFCVSPHVPCRVGGDCVHIT